MDRGIERELGLEAEHLARVIQNTSSKSNSEKLSALRRAPTYQPVKGDHWQCPRCWIEEEKQSDLRPVGHPLGAADADKKFDLFKCNNDKCERPEREFRLGL